MSDGEERHPPRGNGLWTTDGGLETTLVFARGIEIPHFSAFTLLESRDGAEILRAYYRSYVALARRHRLGIIIQTVTWRANRDWGAKLGYDREALAEVNRQGVRLLEEVREEFALSPPEMLISGCLGPRGDGYSASVRRSADEARAYHREQVETLCGTGVDFVSGMTMNHVDEAIGISRAAGDLGVPHVLSFTVETDGRLPDGTQLGDAIEAVDGATGRAPEFYMINCAHPSHFAAQLSSGGEWVERIHGIRANASGRSHAELDASPELDDGDPGALAVACRVLRDRHPHVKIFGGCCGTDERHIESICRALSGPSE